MSDQARIGFHLFTRTCEPIFVEKMRYSSAQNPNRSNAMDFCVEKSFRGGEKGDTHPHISPISLKICVRNTTEETVYILRRHRVQISDDTRNSTLDS